MYSCKRATSAIQVQVCLEDILVPIWFQLLYFNIVKVLFLLKGVQPDGTELAVKQLSSRSQQGIDEFLNEVVLITGVRHRNLVKLKGCCIKDDVRRLLVYEYVENNNLAEVLFGELLEYVDMLFVMFVFETLEA